MQLQRKTAFFGVKKRSCRKKPGILESKNTIAEMLLFKKKSKNAVAQCDYLQRSQKTQLRNVKTPEIDGF